LEIPGLGSKLVNLIGFTATHQQTIYQFTLSAAHAQLPKKWLRKNIAFANLTID
jgi:hypothetical protein